MTLSQRLVRHTLYSHDLAPDFISESLTPGEVFANDNEVIVAGGGGGLC